MMNFVNFMLANWQALLNGLIAVLTGVIAICLVIPGTEPEATLQKIVDFLAKFSKK